MQGRAEKGMIITTGRFTKEAKKEANRDGVTPIELIDGERLVNLFEKHYSVFNSYHTKKEVKWRFGIIKQCPRVTGKVSAIEMAKSFENNCLDSSTQQNGHSVVIDILSFP